MPVYDMKIPAVDIWYDTGLVLDGSVAALIETLGGTWTANPRTGMVGPAGNSKYVAKPQYSLPGQPEGMLVGCIGDPAAGGIVFPIGAGPKIAPISKGALYLSINDDVNHIYGVGFPDNKGAVDVRITVD